MTHKGVIENSAQINDSLEAMKQKKLAQLEQNINVYTMEDGSKLSTKKRAIKIVKPPANNKPTDKQLFLANGLPNCNFLKEHFIKEGRLYERQAIRILSDVTDLLSREPNILEVPAPVTVCGDIHGQYYDLMKLFEVGGDPANTAYLFLGDYVDRGLFSIECLIYLYALKLNYPNTLWMLRGNHECKHLTECFTFKTECLHKYSSNLYEECLKSFNALPLAAIMNKQFFCVHGGLSPELMSLNELIKLDRFQEPPRKGLMCDLLWADPIEEYDNDDMDQEFIRNTVRGCSYAFTYKAACQFLEKTGLLSIIRAHEAQDTGYRMYKRTKSMGFPSLLTMFSAPNYLDTYNNKAAVLKYENNVMNIRQFNASIHPYWLPHFMNVFTWSLPFVGEKVSDMLVSILNICTEEELGDEIPFVNEQTNDKTLPVNPPVDSSINSSPNTQTPHISQPQPDTYSLDSKIQEIRSKVIAIGRVSRMYQVLKQESENIAHLKELNSGYLPKGSLLHGSEGLKRTILTFEEAKKADLMNQAFPSSPEKFEGSDSNRKENFKREIENIENPNPMFQRLIRRLSQG